MKFLVPTLFAVLGLAGCQHSPGLLQRWPESPTYLRVERWELAGGSGFACEVRGSSLTIHTLNDFGKPRKVLFQRSLSGTQRQRIVDAVVDGGLLEKLGRSVPPPPPAPDREVIVLSDGELDRFCLREGKPADVQSMTVEYWNHSDASARRIFAELDRLVPEKFHFMGKPNG